MAGSKRPKKPLGSTYIDTDTGYVMIKVSHEGSFRQRWRAEHRVVMEHHLGRQLKPSEIVHHYDGDKTNNVLSNLEITSRGEHLQHHHGDYDYERVTDEALLDDLRKSNKQAGGYITTRKHNQIGVYSSGTITRRFGSWNAAKEKAGIGARTEKGQQYSDDDVLNDIAKVMQEAANLDISRPFYDKHGGISSGLSYDRFGTWTKAKELARERVMTWVG